MKFIKNQNKKLNKKSFWPDWLDSTKTKSISLKLTSLTLARRLWATLSIMQSISFHSMSFHSVSWKFDQLVSVQLLSCWNISVECNYQIWILKFKTWLSIFWKFHCFSPRKLWCDSAESCDFDQKWWISQRRISKRQIWTTWRLSQIFDKKKFRKFF